MTKPIKPQTPKKPQKPKKPTRQQYAPDFRTEALADRVGVPEAARQLGLEGGLIYNWRKALRLTQTSAEAEQRLATENARLKRQLAEQPEKLAILKKSDGVLREKPEVKYAFMQAHRQEFSVKAMARVLGVARSQFYTWRQRQVAPCRRKTERQERDARIKAAFVARQERYGSPRLEDDLRDAGMPANRKTIAESLQRQGLHARAARKFKATTNSRHSLPVSPNLMEQDSRHLPRTRNGWATSPTCGRTRAGCTWPRSSTCSAAWWWAGR